MRELSGFQRKITYYYLVVVGAFHLYVAYFGSYEAYLQRTIHLTLLLPMAFFLYPIRKGSPGLAGRIPFYDFILAGMSVLPGIYGIIYYEEISTRIRQVDPLTQTQIVLGVVLLLALLEATRRTVGWPLTILAFFFTSYMYLGQYYPGVMRSSPFGFEEVVEQIYLSDEGIFSMPLGVSATFIAIFLIFSGFVEKSGLGDYFKSLAEAFAGRAMGGPAKISVIASCLFGSISGSAVANVYSTGAFTIPLMKRIGYPAYFAGAVEAVASAGGQIMPPLMGAGAFIMAAFLAVPYSGIITAALLPALLYYFAVFMMVHFMAIKSGMRVMDDEDIPNKGAVLKKSYMALPIVVLAAFLFGGNSAMMAGFLSIVTAWGVSMFNPGGRMFLREVMDALYIGMKNLVMICIACAAAGLVIGSVAMTGIGFKFVGAITLLSGSQPLVAVFLIIIVSVILGMGLPTTSAYILAAALCVPVMTKFGFTGISAHMFVFYYAILSNITPPVALAAYAASSISGAPPNKTGFTAMGLGIIAFIIPIFFLYNNAYLLQGDKTNVALAIVSGVAAVLFVAAAMIGHIKQPLVWWKRVAFFGLMILSLMPSFEVTTGAIVIGVTLFVIEFRKPARSNIAFRKEEGILPQA
ncbi:TRAP transporter fused permease subunit [Oleispirillum naphthae]|uniref:TRAP transporter permease n=1 Tax=Oleispirillum naphthae TaxID=2838853 RepID=UPI0030826034